MCLLLPLLGFWGWASGVGRRRWPLIVCGDATANKVFHGVTLAIPDYDSLVTWSMASSSSSMAPISILLLHGDVIRCWASPWPWSSLPWQRCTLPLCQVKPATLHQSALPFRCGDTPRTIALFPFSTCLTFPYSPSKCRFFSPAIFRFLLTCSYFLWFSILIRCVP